MEIMFFNNGNTVVLKNGQQLSEFNESWLLCCVNMMINKGLKESDILNATIELPNGAAAKIYKTKNGYNWRIKT